MIATPTSIGSGIRLVARLLRLAAWAVGALVLAAGVVGCAAPGAGEQDQAEPPEELDEILSQPLEGEEYATPRRCISKFAYRNFEPLGDRYVVFEGPADQLWLNELRGRCPGLSRSSALAFEMEGNQICALDRFKITDWFELSRFRRWPWEWLDGIPCTLGKFQPVSAEQVESIRATLQAR